jgi:dihydroorotate dehydrogenase electron transfer subunit
MAIYRILRDQGGAPRGFTMLIEVVGRGTALLQQKRPGDTALVLGPLGVPFALPGADTGGDSEQLEGRPRRQKKGTNGAETREREHLLVMGGVGAAPFPLLAEELLARGCQVRAFVGARTAEALLCVEDFEQLGVPVEVATDDGSRGYHGFVVGPLQRYLDAHADPGAQLYACGPTPMMRAVHDIALAHELPLQVSFEAPMACGIGVCLSCVLPVKEDQGDGWRFVRCCREGPVFDSRRLVWA